VFEKLTDLAGKAVDAWERVATRAWDGVLRHPTTLEGLGANLRGASELKSRWDRGLEQAWAGWRLPSALDVERMHERLGEVEETLLRLERRLAAADTN
jgi:hypothetical protein